MSAVSVETNGDCGWRSGPLWRGGRDDKGAPASERERLFLSGATRGLSRPLPFGWLLNMRSFESSFDFVDDQISVTWLRPAPAHADDAFPVLDALGEDLGRLRHRAVACEVSLIFGAEALDDVGACGLVVGVVQHEGIAEDAVPAIDVDGHFAGLRPAWAPALLFPRRTYPLVVARIITWCPPCWRSGLGSGPDLNPCPSAKPGRGQAQSMRVVAGAAQRATAASIVLAGSEGRFPSPPLRGREAAPDDCVRDPPGGQTPLANSGSRLGRAGPEWARVDCHQEVGERADNSEAAR